MLNKFRQGAAKVLNSNWFWIVLISSIGIFAILCILHRDTKQEKEINSQLEFLNRVCRKAGTAIDANRNEQIARTIYECPDGQFHIR